MILRARRVLFLQCTNAGLYPPIIHAAHVFADHGWSVDILSSPDNLTASLLVPPHPALAHHTTRMRPQNAVRALEYFAFLTKAMYLSIKLRPDIIYASDTLGAGPGLIAALLAGAALVYHEHDTPAVSALRPWLAQLRKTAARRARIVILPNADRGIILCRETNKPSDNLRIVWNMPRRSELPPLTTHTDDELKLYFHGSITPDRLPEAVVDAVLRFNGRVKMLIAGYEVPGAPGYSARLVERGAGEDGQSLVEYLGQIPRSELLQAASRAHVGLSFMPNNTEDLNMRHMVGASNKAFDYMAAGLSLLVSDLPEWNATYVTAGFGRACDPFDVDFVASAIHWFLHHPSERQEMGQRGRQKIEAEWNYDVAFAPILEELSAPSDAMPNRRETIISPHQSKRS